MNNTSQRVFKFESNDVRVTVPAKGLFGNPPSRSVTLDIAASSDYVHATPFYEHAYYHANGLTDSQTVDDTNNGGPGLHYLWTLENGHIAPLNGRTAEMKVNLLVKRKTSYITSTPGFSSVYEAIRKQFFDIFFHNGLVADSYFPVTDQINFSDQPLYMGQTLLMLSGEFEIWHRNDDNDKKREVLVLMQTILDAIDNHLEGASKNGFIRRDSITGITDPLLTRTFAKVDSDFQSGRNNEISIDNYIGLMAGLLSVQYSTRSGLPESPAISQHAAVIIDRFFKYLKAHKFIVEAPGGQHVRRGEDARGFVTLLHGLYAKATGENLFNSLEVDFGIGSGNSEVVLVGSIWDKGVLLSDILQQLGNSINSFAIHMALSLLCSSEVWTQEQLERSTDQTHLLSIVLYSYYHNTAPMIVSWDNVEQLLNRCPSSGPSNKDNTWNQDNIWVRGGTGTPSNGDTVAYNGLDYMVLHNFAQLVYDKALV